jgi:hypothetical protein
VGTRAKLLFCLQLLASLWTLGVQSSIGSSCVNETKKRGSVGAFLIRQTELGV